MYNLSLPFGARIIKTGIAVGISIYLAHLLNLEPIIFAAISTMLNIQPSIYQSFENAVKQIASHVLSVSIALPCGYFIGAGSIEIAFVTMLVISINIKFNMQQYVVMGVVAAIFVLDAPQNEFLSHAITRSYVIFLGLVVALCVNATIAPPKYKEKLIKGLIELNDYASNLFTQSVQEFISLKTNNELEQQRVKFKELLDSANDFLELYEKQIIKDKIQKKRLKFYKKYIDFNKLLYHSSLDINIATKQRLILRDKMGNPPISPVFKEILSMIGNTLTKFNTLNKALNKAICENDMDRSKIQAYNDQVDINNEFWENLSQHVDKWHSNLTGADFLHAFMYVSMTMNNIKIVYREANLLLNDIQNIQGGNE